jgi:hypothetical protein
MLGHNDKDMTSEVRYGQQPGSLDIYHVILFKISGVCQTKYKNIIHRWIIYYSGILDLI